MQADDANSKSYAQRWPTAMVGVTLASYQVILVGPANWMKENPLIINASIRSLVLASIGEPATVYCFFLSFFFFFFLVEENAERKEKQGDNSKVISRRSSLITLLMEVRLQCEATFVMRCKGEIIGFVSGWKFRS